MSRPKRTRIEVAMDAVAALNAEERQVCQLVWKEMERRASAPITTAPRTRKPKPAPEPSNG